MVQAKFRCEFKTEIEDGYDVGFRALADHQDWAKYTPHGELRMSITNPAATDQFEVGKVYTLDISPDESLS